MNTPGLSPDSIDPTTHVEFTEKKESSEHSTSAVHHVAAEMLGKNDSPHPPPKTVSSSKLGTVTDWARKSWATVTARLAKGEKEVDHDMIGLEDDLAAAVLECRLSAWYESLQTHTITSKTVALSLEEVEALTTLQQFNRKHITLSEADLEKVQYIVNSLEIRIDNAIRSFKEGGFVKLDTRSPKDAVYEVFNERTATHLKPLLETAPRYKSKEARENEQLISFFTACGKAMCSHSGKEAIELLMQSTRISHDLRHMAEDAKIKGVDFQAPAFVIREWKQIPLENEFRLFICRGKLTAASQYFHMCYFPGLVKDRKQVQQRLAAFWEGVKELVPKDFDSYIMDVALPKEGDPVIVELNPFNRGTGAPFYSWTPGSKDREHLINGPYELRVRKEPLKDGRSEWLVPAWERYIDGQGK